MKYSKLRGLIKEKGLTESGLGSKINLSPTAISRRLSGETEWSLPQVRAVCDVLEIQASEISKYFFV